MEFVPRNIEKYCQKYSLKDSKLLSDLSKWTWETEESPQMISGSFADFLETNPEAQEAYEETIEQAAG